MFPGPWISGHDSWRKGAALRPSTAQNTRHSPTSVTPQRHPDAWPTKRVVSPVRYNETGLQRQRRSAPPVRASTFRDTLRGTIPITLLLRCCLNPQHHQGPSAHRFVTASAGTWHQSCTACTELRSRNSTLDPVLFHRRRLYEKDTFGFGHGSCVWHQRRSIRQQHRSGHRSDHPSWRQHEHQYQQQHKRGQQQPHQHQQQR